MDMLVPFLDNDSLEESREGCEASPQPAGEASAYIPTAKETGTLLASMSWRLRDHLTALQLGSGLRAMMQFPRI